MQQTATHNISPYKTHNNNKADTNWKAIYKNDRGDRDILHNTLLEDDDDEDETRAQGVKPQEQHTIAARHIY